jgi:hypothetical protein
LKGKGTRSPDFAQKSGRALSGKAGAGVNRRQQLAEAGASCATFDERFPALRALELGASEAAELGKVTVFNQRPRAFPARRPISSEVPNNMSARIP